MTERRRNEARDTLTRLDAVQVVALITAYHGVKIFDDGFIEFLADRGWLDPDAGEEEV